MAAAPLAAKVRHIGHRGGGGDDSDGGRSSGNCGGRVDSYLSLRSVVYHLNHISGVGGGTISSGKIGSGGGRAASGRVPLERAASAV
eukprot:6198060-Pleurochrysis_carterae.AAC.6